MSVSSDTSRADAATSEVLRLPVDFPRPKAWAACLAISLVLLLLLFISLTVLLMRGVGIFGNNIPVGWGFPIINYIWFLGIGHAGTLISAMLLLTGTGRRTALNRFAEAMTLFAVLCAGLYPILHLGRPWLFYWTAPYPNTMNVWPQFKSPLSWDFFAVLVYLIVSLCFWYIGTIPDLAAMRDRAKSRHAQVLYGLAALGWRGSARHWARWQQAYRLCAAIAVPLVFIVTASYSLLLAAGPIPGWNSTIFPPYFLAGAVFSGFAVVAMIAVSLRGAFALDDIITVEHLDLVGRLLLATGLMTSYGYVADMFDALYSSSIFDHGTLHDRLVGPYAASFWGAVIFNFVPLQALWFQAMRRSSLVLAAIGLSVTIGMWLERDMLLVSGLGRDYLVSSWHAFQGTLWDWMLFAGMLGLFLTGFLLFVRVIPVISAFEVRHQREQGDG